jgi:hypothetical protein
MLQFPPQTTTLDFSPCLIERLISEIIPFLCLNHKKIARRTFSLWAAFFFSADNSKLFFVLKKQLCCRKQGSQSVKEFSNFVIWKRIIAVKSQILVILQESATK